MSTASTAGSNPSFELTEDATRHVFRRLIPSLLLM